MSKIANSRTTLNVGLLNIWGLFADWESRFEIIDESKVLEELDVLLLQEVCQGGRIDQLEKLKFISGLEHDAYFSTKTVIPDVNEGVAILSRYPLDEITEVDLGAGRALLCAEIIDGLTVATAHLSFHGRERSEQVKKLLKTVTRDRVVLGADFNGSLDTFAEALDKYWTPSADDSPTWPACPPEVFSKAWVEGTGRVVNFDLDPRRVDYLLYRGVKEIDSFTTNVRSNLNFATDHALVTSKIQLDWLSKL